MTPAPLPGRRLSLLGCLLLGAALLLPGCGDDTAASVGGAATQTAVGSKPSPAKRGSTAAGCPAQADALVTALDRLRRQLAVGLSYDQYTARVRALRHGYDRIPIGHLGLACLRSTATPAEAALNKYVDAANAWGECLADAACATATIEPILQRKWRVASRLLDGAG